MTEHHIQDAESAAFERELGALLHERPCDKCGFRLGPAPRKMVDHRQSSW